jgi:chromosome segregation ATPase
MDASINHLTAVFREQVAVQTNGLVAELARLRRVRTQTAEEVSKLRDEVTQGQESLERLLREERRLKEEIARKTAESLKNEGKLRASKEGVAGVKKAVQKIAADHRAV